MKLVHVNVDQMQVFVVIDNAGIMINADLNAKSLLAKEDVMKDLFGILINVNVIIHMIMDNIQIMKIANAEKSV